MQFLKFSLKASLAQVQNLTGWTDLNFENMWYIDDTLYIEVFLLAVYL